MGEKNATVLKKFTIAQFLNFCLGFFGLQFAWQMRIILSGPVTEGLGASPFIFGLIWLAGPVTGMIVQPIIGSLSDKTYTKFGRRRPYLFLGAIFASLALWAFPNSPAIASKIGSILHLSLPSYAALLVAAIMIWVIDSCVNAAQGPYRALVPDIIPQEQHSIANSFLSFAIGLGSVVAAGAAPFLKWAINYQMSINAQFVMAALAFSLAMLWTCLTIKECKPVCNYTQEDKEKAPESFKDSFIIFFKSSPEILKICSAQFFTWIGIMSMFIFFTQYATHTVCAVPDLTLATDITKKSYEAIITQSTNFASICFTIFNLVCFLVSIPIGILSSKFGNKNIHAIALIITALAFTGMGFTSNPKLVLAFMAISGIGWASILALPFAMLSEFIPKGSEGSIMGIFNMFIAGPQIFVCTLIAWLISQCSFHTPVGVNYHWEYTLLIGALTLFISAIITNLIKEK